MERFAFVNDLIARRGYGSYLEIGVEDPGAFFDKINLLESQKVGVDPAPKGARANVYISDSDRFFDQLNNRTFDVVYIDGLHTFEQCDRDIANALSVLNPGGAVVIDDALPKDEPGWSGKWVARPHSEYKWPEAWMGEVWKAVWKHFHESGYECVTVEIEHGQAVIDTTRNRNGRKVKIKPFDESADYDFFDENRKNTVRPVSLEEYYQWIDAAEAEEIE